MFTDDWLFQFLLFAVGYWLGFPGGWLLRGILRSEANQ